MRRLGNIDLRYLIAASSRPTLKFQAAATPPAGDKMRRACTGCNLTTRNPPEFPPRQSAGCSGSSSSHCQAIFCFRLQRKTQRRNPPFPNPIVVKFSSLLLLPIWSTNFKKIKIILKQLKYSIFWWNLNNLIKNYNCYKFILCMLWRGK